MTNTVLPDLDQKSREIDRDKRAAETAAMLALLPLLGASAEHAAQAVRIGQNPVTAANAVLSGDPSIHQPGIAPVLASAAVAAWLMGYYRSRANAHAYETGRPVSMAGVRRAVQSTPNVLRPAGEHSDAIGRMVNGAGGPDAMARRYAAAERQAGPIVRNIETRLADRLSRIKPETPPGSMPYTQPPGAHLPDAISKAMDEVRIAFEKTGVSPRTTFYVPNLKPKPGNPSTAANAETIIEAIVGQEYESGRGAGAKSTKSLWGWTWSAVIDGHECPLCRKLDGTTAPVDDPLWEQFGPPLHFGCRCSRIERYVAEDGSTPAMNRPDLTDEHIIEGVRQRHQLVQWWNRLPESR